MGSAMTRRAEVGTARRVFRAGVVLLLALQPSASARLGTDPATAGRAALPSCCRAANEVRSCCPGEERQEDGPVWVPLCCGWDAPPAPLEEVDPGPACAEGEAGGRQVPALAHALATASFVPAAVVWAATPRVAPAE